MYSYFFLQVTASNDFNLKIWDTKTYTEKHKITGHSSAINAVAYKVLHYVKLIDLIELMSIAFSAFQCLLSPSADVSVETVFVSVTH